MYKPRFSFKNIILSTYNITSTSTNSFSNTYAPSQLKLEKVLVVSKLSIYEFERSRHNNLSDVQFEKVLRNRGSDFDKMLYHYQLHKCFESAIVNNFTKAGIDVKVVNRINYTDDLIEWADVIIPTGGDGTFLLAASRVRNNKKPVIGFNSDPNRSEGHLCLPKKYSYNILEALERLKAGKFEWLLRSRIRTTMYGQKGEFRPTHLHLSDRSYVFNSKMIQFIDPEGKSGQILPYLALNEVFMGECLSARVSHLEMWLNNSEQHTNMKCSGLCVTTGTGSTSWHLSINRLPVQSVAELLRLIDIEATEEKDSLATVLADMYNKNLVFNPDDNRLGYTIRDLISAGVWPQPKGIKSRGFASTIKVKSKCLDACLVVDGGVAVPFNDGSTVILEIKPEDCLRTVIFAD
ncbi:hypothetical protein ILUMI_24583 [Ignelater luminosus]|uniref:NAD(+) kinase n=1 Tax=Ignelater luminosus TaxID=2038154 RepID=A0A8K0CA80_IGNLU|nr:hypothetical protein ILUMI_24583 [Ignelater luminosus]